MIRKPIKIKEIWTDYVVCMECGNKYKQINSHIVHNHKMTSQQYKDKYPGFPLQCGTIASQGKGENNPNYSSGKRYAKKKRLEEYIKTGTEGIHFVTCMECGEQVRMLTTSGHLKKHNMTRKDYQKKYPNYPVTCKDFCENTSSVSNSKLTHEERVIRGINSLQGRTYGSKTFTIPHQRVNQMLDELEIPYENELIILGRNIDIRIDDTHFIEVQGDYWHCNPTKYAIPKDNNQERKIGLDVVKANIFKRKQVSILYLWEYDVMHRPEVCEKLIQKYILDKLTNYHSFNYTEQGTLKKEVLDFYY